MHARVVLGVGKGVLFREVSSVQECPHRESGSIHKERWNGYGCIREWDMRPGRMEVSVPNRCSLRLPRQKCSMMWNISCGLDTSPAVVVGYYIK